MIWVLERTASFFIENVPAGETILTGGPIGFFWALACLAFAGSMKRYKGLPTGYTRKIFHFLIFFTVSLIQWRWGTPSVCLFGGMTSLVIALAIFLGSGNLLYEAMAREKDAPHRTHFIVVPYFATLIGGLAGNILFGPIAMVGYLVTGLGDAVGEPVGTRFGKHTYNVPSLASVKAVRSWEGSAAVLIMCMVAIVSAISLLPELSFSWRSMMTVPALGLICALVEAVSPHGWDNMTMQLIPTFLATWMLF
jgi:phytol kinase